MAPDTGAAPTPVEVPNRELVECALKFSQAFLRWVDDRPSGELPYARARLLESLHCNGPAKMRDLADGLGLSARNLTSVADALEAEALLRRTPHPTDRRATVLELTDAGREAVERSFAPQLMKIAALFDVLEPDEKARLADTLGTLVAALVTDGRP